jgi:Dolichyl-phosphate-mannose-protein mannosyltransferase
VSTGETAAARPAPDPAPGAQPLARAPGGGPPLARRTALWWLAGILLVALALRLWHIRHGLPFAYNADEAEHFVPKAIGMFRGSLDPGYYENPSALTYALYALFKLRFTAGFPFGGARDLVRGFAADPEAAFVTARVFVALVGTLVVGLVYWAGARFYERRTGLVAAALMTVAFLPVFYSKHALNDIVVLAPLTVGLVASLLAYERGSLGWWALAGAAIGVATATKYTAGAAVVCVLVAAALRIERARSAPATAGGAGPRDELRRVLLGLVVAGAACIAAFAALNPFVLINHAEARGQIGGQSRQADTGKLGQDSVHGWFYYLGTFGWGLGWLPLAAAVGGAVVALLRDWRRALLLIVFPVLFFLYMGAQARFFGRWMLPVYPALCVLAGYGIVALAELAGRRPRRVAALVVVLAAVACAQGLLSSIHVDRVLGRTDTRAQALDWIGANVPAAAPVVVEPFVPDSWRSALERRLWPVHRPYQAYEKELRARRIERYRRRGYCWVVVGSYQKDRGLKAGLRRARAYYSALDAASVRTVRFSPYRAGARPVRFSYDKSFNYQPRAYERPGPLVEIHALRDCTPAVP